MTRSILLSVLLVLTGSVAAAATRGFSPLVPDAFRHPRPMLSGPYLRMLRDEMAAGRVLRPEVVARFGLDRLEDDPADALDRGASTSVAPPASVEKIESVAL